ncbi:hypothetical protein NliqN6_6669 [Naganishia liquefaciens]|uniref:Uncharacterized protein n=1 Tax=Naganishia liquefaciens TaxID=104408 RepID=A0A8H3YJK9_9TREE|nr:hypothetical protein NliqN6_6669 [Naganishia liquefaciens]
MPKRPASHEPQPTTASKVSKASGQEKNAENAAGLFHPPEATDDFHSHHMDGEDERTSIDDDPGQLSTRASTGTAHDHTLEESVKPLVFAFSGKFKDRIARKDIKGTAWKLLMAGISPKEVASMLGTAGEGSFEVTVRSIADSGSMETGS